MLIQQLNLANDQIGPVSFASKASLDYPLSHDGSAVEEALSRLRASGGTNLPAGIALAHDELAGGHHSSSATKVIVLLSDGRAKEKEAEALAAAQAAKQDGIRIITIGLGSDAEVDRELLHAIASSEQDAYYQPISAQLAETFLSIAQSIHTCASSVLLTPTNTLTGTPVPADTPLPTETLMPTEVPMAISLATNTLV